MPLQPKVLSWKEGLLAFQCEIFIIMTVLSKLYALSSQAPFVFWLGLLHSCLGSGLAPGGMLERLVLNAL